VTPSAIAIFACRIEIRRRWSRLVERAGAAGSMAAGLAAEPIGASP
jgi:hypothetical protein